MTSQKIIPIPTEEKENSFKYIVTLFDKDGWADAITHKPIPFDLVTVQTNTGKKVAGWWNKFKWEGIRLRPIDQILIWKRRTYEHIR